jgi:hypothetical protein
MDNLILVYTSLNHLSYKVLDDMGGKRHSLNNKLINLINKSFFLGICKEFMVKGSSLLTRDAKT